PFSLLPAGVELFKFIKPFFDDIEKVVGRIRGASQQLRIAAPSIVLHDYVPELLRRIRRRFPIFRLELHEAARADAERLLQAREIDVAITVIVNSREKNSVPMIASSHICRRADGKLQPCNLSTLILYNAAASDSVPSAGRVI